MRINEAVMRFDFIRGTLLSGVKPRIEPNETNIELIDIAIQALEKQAEVNNKLQDYYNQQNNNKALNNKEKWLVCKVIEECQKIIKGDINDKGNKQGRI